MQDNKTGTIISFVGQRASAVITPINTFLKTYTNNNEDIEIILLYTDEVRNVLDRTKEWFQKNFSSIVVNPILFNKEKEFIESICQNKGKIFFNVNPGMSWQIAFVGLYLPEKTVCLASDTKYLYKWNLFDDIEKCKHYELSDIGMDSYCELSSEIEIDKTSKFLKNSLSTKISDYLKTLGDNQSFNVKFIRNQVPNNITEEINKHLIWVKERHGHLYLLFDLHARERIEQKDLKDYFRLITAVFDSINYFVTIATDEERIIERAKYEGIDYIDTNYKEWHGSIKEWICGKKDLIPKSIVPDITENSYRRTFEVEKSTLFACLGDNIDSILKTIHSHFPKQAKSICLFYDCTSRRIKFIGERIKNEMTIKRIPIKLIPTDHLGSGMIKQAHDRINKDAFFNITPGTKMQTLSLTIAARKKNLFNKIYSINNERIEQIVGHGNNLDVKGSDIDEIISCQIPPLKKTEKFDYQNSLWDEVLQGLANGSLKPENLYVKFKRRPDIEIDDKGQVEFHLNGRYLINKSFFQEEPGYWWEAVVMKAVEDKLKIKPYGQVKWDWINNSGKYFYSEIDIVFSYSNNIAAISCKTGRKNLEMNSYLIKSEASKRLGRLSLCFLAVPYENWSEKELAGMIVGKVMILTPKILADEVKLKNKMEELLTTLRTTGKKH